MKKNIQNNIMFTIQRDTIEYVCKHSILETFHLP